MTVETPTVEAVLEYLYSLRRFDEKPSLTTIQRILTALGNPQEQFRSIHITGSVGKGSTAAVIASILHTAGYKTGLYTSPHLIACNERIQINGLSINNKSLVALTQEIRGTVESLGIAPRFHEFLVALCFLYFARMHVDIAVIEVGMGGRRDTTNVITPIVSVITNISLEHAHLIGPTKHDIAVEKAGIIKPRVPVVSAETDPQIIAYLESECHKQHTVLTHVSSCTVTAHKSEDSEQEFTVQGIISGTFRTRLLGMHQVTNILTALLALKAAGLLIPEHSLSEGVYHAQWSGRLQRIHEQPLVLIDGAHNEAGLRALVDYMHTLPQKKIVVFGLSEHRDPAVLGAIVAQFASHIIVTQGSFKPQKAATVAHAIRHSSIEVQPDPILACTHAMQLCDDNTIVVVSGSLYIIGDILSRKDALRKEHV
jgi:dihydrofolate synthase / folylpolyglutamate synthase